MIRSVEIEGLRGIRNAKLENFTPLVVLVGPNGSGKSTVLEAMLIAASPKPVEAIVRAVQRHRGVSQGARWLFWKGSEVVPARITVATEAEQRGGTLYRDRTAPTEQTAIKLELNGHAIATVAFVVGNTYTTRAAASPPVRLMLEHVQDVRLVDVHTSDLQPALHQLFTQSVEQSRREQARAILGELLSGSVNLEILTEGDAPILYLVYEDRSVPVVLAGDGVQSLVRLSLELAARPHGVVLIEEPELHQHPGALRQSARAIIAAIRRDIQVILTTHSLELIDSLLSEATLGGRTDIDKLSVYGLCLKNGALISTRYSGDEVASARGAIQDDLR